MFDDDPRADLDPLTVVGHLHSGSMGKPAEGHVAASIERGVADLDAGRARTTEEVLAYLEAQRRSRG
jgi:hypothetical protein